MSSLELPTGDEVALAKRSDFEAGVLVFERLPGPGEACSRGVPSVLSDRQPVGGLRRESVITGDEDLEAVSRFTLPAAKGDGVLIALGS